jgi:pyruvate-formate lyase-activating enzyme
MARAVVVNPPLELSLSFIDYPYFTALAVYTAAATLSRHGWEVRILDGHAAADADLLCQGSHAWLGQPAATFLDRLHDLDAEVVVIHASPFLLATPRWLDELVRHARGSGRRVVVAELFTGGMHYVEYDAAALVRDVPGIDLLLRYEGEPLLARLRPEGAPPPGTIWENHEPFPLDDLPAPAFTMIDAESHFAALSRMLGCAWRPAPLPPFPARTLPLVTARGCPFTCSFCSKNPGLPGERRQVRAIPLPTVDKWLRIWVDALQLQRLVILDELVNFNAARLDGLLDIFERLDLRVELPNGLRADRLTDRQIARLAGRTSGLAVSMESAVPRVQHDLIKKDLDPAEVERVAESCRRHKTALDIHYLIGIPGETRAELVATLETAIRLFEDHGARPLVQFAAPLPGTALADKAQQQGLLTRPLADVYATFQENGILATEQFDPALLQRARRLVQCRTTAPPPRKVIVNLTYRCNNHCAFCAIGDRPQIDAEVVAIEQALERYRQRGAELCDIDGGEPTLHPGLLRIVATARALAYRQIALTTNGRRLSYPAFAHAVVRSGVNELLISLHAGEAAGQDSMTGVPGSFDQTVAGIRNALIAVPSATQVAVNTTVVGDNIAALDPLAALLVTLGVRRWNLQLVTPFGRATARQVPTEGLLRRHLGALLDQPPPGIAMQVINCPPCLLPGHEDATLVDSGKAARDMVFVGAAGENLQAFLAQRRQRTARCRDCVDSLGCAGEYLFA